MTNITEYGEDYSVYNEGVCLYHMNEERPLYLTKDDLVKMLDAITKLESDIEE